MNKSKAKAAGVTWVKPAEPSFLKKFKKDVGYKEGPSVETKMQTMPDLEDDSGSDREDELPQVVVLKGGDLSAEDVQKIKDDLRPEKGDAADGKILFKKPAKRSSSDKFQGIKASSSKKKKKKKSDDEEEKEEEEGEEVKTEVKTEVKSGKKVKNTSLLSFGEDEEEDEEN